MFLAAITTEEVCLYWYQQKFCSQGQARPSGSLSILHEYCWFTTLPVEEEICVLSWELWYGIVNGSAHLSQSYFAADLRADKNPQEWLKYVMGNPMPFAGSNQVPIYFFLSLFLSAHVLSQISVGAAPGPGLTDFRAAHFFFLYQLPLPTICLL